MVETVGWIEILTWVGVIYVAGSLLILERRCLGQMAVVQPLVVCLAAGWVSGQVSSALWFGISLQLFSVARVRHVDWALAGVVAAIGLAFLDRLGAPVAVGEPSALVLIATVTLIGIASKALDRYYARADGERLRRDSPWKKDSPADAIDALVTRISRRWFLVGGVEVLVGVGLVVLAVSLAGFMSSIAGLSDMQILSAVVPALASAVAISSLLQYRFALIATASAAVCAVILL